MENNKINEKATTFQTFLSENKLSYFSSEIRNDELNTVLFRTELLINGSNLPLLLFTDDSIYTMIKILIVPNGVNENNKESILAKINKLNLQYKIFKYTITDDNDIVLDISLPAVPEHFDERLVMSIIDIAVKHLVEEYPALMHVVWAADKK